MTADAEALALALADIAAEAGRFLAGVTDRAAGRVTKPDGTPSTGADLEAERLILARLAAAFPDVPVVAEESAGAPVGDDAPFFLVDPLDGTRDYLAGSGEYSVNIALVARGRPVAAALAAPTLGRVWAAGDATRCAALPAAAALGPWHAVRTRAAVADRPLVALVSRRHGDEETEACLGALPVGERREVSSAAKFGVIASGEADLYVRCGPTMEWDTAAGDHIVTCAGGRVVGPGDVVLRYGERGADFRNGAFAACAGAALAARVSPLITA